MRASARSRPARLAALAAVGAPAVAGLLLLTPGRASADASPSTITCPKSDGSAGGAVVSKTGSCGVYTGSTQAVITATVGCTTFLGLPQCSGDPTFVVRSPSGSTMFSRSLGTGKEGSMSYALPAGSPDGTYTATLTGGGAQVSATLEISAPRASSAPAASSSTTAAGGGPASAPTGGETSAASGAATQTGSGSGQSAAQTAAAAEHRLSSSFRSFAPPAGIAQLPPLPQFPSSANGEPGSGTYAPTLPYAGSTTVAQKVSRPTLLGHVTNTFGNRQVSESVAAACLALLLAAHLRRLSRRPAGDPDL